MLNIYDLHKELIRLMLQLKKFLKISEKVNKLEDSFELPKYKCAINNFTQTKMYGIKNIAITK